MDINNEEQPISAVETTHVLSTEDDSAKLHAEYRSRLVTANLRTEAVKAGMVDLDGLKLLDRSAVTLDANDAIVDGRKLMAEFKRSKPWLFASSYSSSPATAPASQPVRQKNAMEMSDEEYSAARIALTRHRP